jgi:hypothetical protein
MLPVFLRRMIWKIEVSKTYEAMINLRVLLFRNLFNYYTPSLSYSSQS